jgi:hypothetical protein
MVLMLRPPELAAVSKASKKPIKSARYRIGTGLILY